MKLYRGYCNKGSHTQRVVITRSKRRNVTASRPEFSALEIPVQLLLSAPESSTAAGRRAARRDVTNNEANYSERLDLKYLT